MLQHSVCKSLLQGRQGRRAVALAPRAPAPPGAACEQSHLHFPEVCLPARLTASPPPLLNPVSINLGQSL